MTNHGKRTVAVLIDAANDRIRPADLEVITLARGLGGVAAVAGGELTPKAKDELARYGVTTLVEVESDVPFTITPAAAHGFAAGVRHVGADLALTTTTFANREIAALAAQELGAGLVADAQPQLDEAGNLLAFKRVFAGTWDIYSAFTTDVAVITVRANSIQAAPGDAANLNVVSLSVKAPARAAAVTTTRRSVHPAGDASRPTLSEAAYVVAGGRGTEGDFGPINTLADALGAAVGATRDAVDEGWVDHDAQIGQTGVTVAPLVYIGAGISGAPHHRGGMQAAQTIVAVNVDAETPLFDICDFAVVGDLAAVLPQAAQRIREYRAAK
ncbi:electron transfer flavoprotein subunit alpha/FixB family protein [Rarobacter incanus]|uniref:Electron transfer flavoprotein alpha subunit apoprotein n=1 Tax=Rarobacter incanus TaxID=153494 RepID=A0A542SN69_9MICO|nr:electron transfer flavoprotein subunit alpha/FixB family protein [Rarobacter incanus]TQK76076.1 electron transfer flavoprotein alpha subunit apoprotein [Rarobacter incanus]